MCRQKLWIIYLSRLTVRFVDLFGLVLLLPWAKFNNFDIIYFLLICSASNLLFIFYYDTISQDTQTIFY